MIFNKTYEIITNSYNDNFLLKDKRSNKVLPYNFEYIDLTDLTTNHQISVVRATIEGKPQLFDLKKAEVLNYKIKQFTNDKNGRFITMILKSDNFAIFDPISKKMRIMPKEITDTFARLSYKDGYILVRLFGGSFTFYHLTRYHLLNVRYTHDEIKDLGYKMRWGDIIKKSPEDFAHLPNTYIYDKKVVQQCHRIISKLLEEKKQILPKEEYLEYRKKITQIYNARILAAYPNKNKIEK